MYGRIVKDFLPNDTTFSMTERAAALLREHPENPAAMDEVKKQAPLLVN